MLFHYNTLIVKLFPLTKSLKVYLDQPHLNKEMLFELEGLFSWLETHLEVKSVLFSSTQKYFCLGFSPEESLKVENTKLQGYLERIQKLTHAMSSLPQTFICDLKAGAKAEGAEFSLGCDLVLGHRNSTLQFNHLSQGKSPQSGGIGLLKAKVGLTHAKNWMLLEKEISATELLSTGILYEIYEEQDKMPEKALLQKINQQSDVARIQTKRALLESALPEIENAKVYESIFAKATLSTDDWKEYLSSQQEKRQIKFKRARDIKPTTQTRV